MVGLDVFCGIFALSEQFAHTGYFGIDFWAPSPCRCLNNTDSLGEVTAAAGGLGEASNEGPKLAVLADGETSIFMAVARFKLPRARCQRGTALSGLY